MILCAACLVCAAHPAPAFSEAPRYTIPAYSPQELSAVRAWEETWAGAEVSSKNIDRVSEFIPDCLAEVYRNPAMFGDSGDGYCFRIIPYRRCTPTRGVVRATRSYYPKVRTDEDGVILNYADIAGVPFPEPGTGMQIAWNYDFNTRGDSSHYRRLTPSLAFAGKGERHQDAECWELFFVHRVDTEPCPRLPENRKKIHWAGFYHMYKPNEFLNTRRFNIRYLDFDKQDDQYMYNAQTRRLRRLSGAQRTDSVDGSIVIYDDEYCWNGHITANTYQYHGREEFLAPRHVDIDELERDTGEILFSNLPRERLKVYVVIARSKDPSYIYSKRIWYVDPETYQIRCTIIYDRKDRLWKYIEQFSQDIATASGEIKNYIVGCHVIDFQREYAAVSTQQVRGIGIAVDRDLFTVHNLRKAGY